VKVHAVANNLRISPRKMGLVASLVRGRSVNDALVILQHTPKKAAPMLAKIINSAVANARHNHKLDPEGLTIDELHVGPDTPMRRHFAAARGHARPYLKRSSHIRVIVTAPEAAPKAAAKASDAKSKEPAEEK
jgi:large subunit ribosomal protein L22